jgi:nucleoside-diphosphate-sugar epimerase
MTATALVIGGTGPTGHYIVNGLLERGYSVTILHRGHEIDEIPPQVQHIHTDPYNEQCLQQALAQRYFDVCVATYGRLRVIANVMQGRCARFLSAGGAPAYRGYMNPELCPYHGLTVPLRETAQLVQAAQEDEKGWRIVLTEKALMKAQPEATHFRYPYVYGAYQLCPREWLFVRRFRDGRRRIILPDGGLTLHSYGYAENIAHAILLAIDQPQACKGKIYNVGDEEVLSLRQVVEVIAEHMGVALEIINMPWELAAPTRPFIMQPLSSHRVQDMAAIRNDLGYRDKVRPAIGLAHTVDWLLANPPQAAGTEEMVLQDPFDYAAEDQLIDAWQTLIARVPRLQMKSEPGLTLSYSGPGGRGRSQQTFVE